MKTENTTQMVMPMTPKQAAEYIGCSEYTIRDLARRHKIPNYRVASKIMFNRYSLDQWVKSQEEMAG